MVTGRNIGIAGGACAIVLGASLATYSVVGITHDRDYWRNLALRPAPTVAPPTPGRTQPAAGGPAHSTSPPATRSPSPTPTPRVVQVAVRSSRTAGGPTPRSARSSASTPSPRKSTPPRCPAAALTLRLPVGVLPCTTAVLGGSR